MRYVRIEFLWLLGIVSNYRIANVKSQYGSLRRIVFKNSTYIDVEENKTIPRTRQNREVCGSPKDLFNCFVSVKPYKSRARFSKYTKPFGTDSYFRAEQHLKFSATGFKDSNWHPDSALSLFVLWK